MPFFVSGIISLTVRSALDFNRMLYGIKVSKTACTRSKIPNLA